MMTYSLIDARHDVNIVWTHNLIISFELIIDEISSSPFFLYSSLTGGMTIKRVSYQILSEANHLCCML